MSKQSPERKPRATAPIADDETLEKVAGLGRIQATGAECAAFFNIAQRTWENFVASDPAVQAALETGRGEGRVSLRRAQYDLALGEKDASGKYTRLPNVGMAIWLGKQELGQRESVEHTGKNGGPFRHVLDLSAFSDDELDTFEALLTKAGAPAGESGGDIGHPPGKGETAH